MAELLFRCVIPGRPIVKKNTKKIVRSGGRSFAVYSKAYKLWEECAMDYIPSTYITFDFPVHERIKFFLKNHQGEPDLSNLVEGPNDLLQKAGVIKDDRLIHVIHATKEFDGNPRVEIELYSIGD